MNSTDSIRHTDEAKWQLLSLKRAELALHRVFELFLKHGIEPIVIKGWAAARNYPAGHYRNFVDIDLAVRNDVFDQALDISRSSDISGYNIDLHSELRHFDITPWEDLFDRSILVDVDGVKVRVLAPEDHLRVLCAHWLNDGGEYRERLWDIYYAVTSRALEFDWDTCLNSAGPIRRNWIVTAILIANKYLDLDIANIPLLAEETSLPKWVEATIEREWDSDIRLLPLSSARRDRKLLVQQIRKRVPPNPIQATIECGALFDDAGRLPLQLQAAFRRFWISTGKSIDARRKRQK